MRVTGCGAIAATMRATTAASRRKFCENRRRGRCAAMTMAAASAASGRGAGARACGFAPALHEIDRKLQCRAQAAGVGQAAAGQVERGAVIDRSAHNRQSERDIDAAAESGALEWRQALVVIHR